jgi:hypothetical protein
MLQFAFFDFDSLEISPNGMTYVCHPQASSISEKLFETYSIISGLAAPLVFSVDVNRNTPDKNSRRSDFLAIPVNPEEMGWREAIPDRFKFYIKRETNDDKEKVAIFNNNKNALDCIKLINAEEWIVFGNGVRYGVDHVVNTLLGIARRVKFIPELIIPASDETAGQLNSYFKKWQEQGATAIAWSDVSEFARCHKY